MGDLSAHAPRELPPSRASGRRDLLLPYGLHHIDRTSGSKLEAWSSCGSAMGGATDEQKQKLSRRRALSGATGGSCSHKSGERRRRQRRRLFKAGRQPRDRRQPVQAAQSTLGTNCAAFSRSKAAAAEVLLALASSKSPEAASPNLPSPLSTRWPHLQLVPRRVLAAALAPRPHCPARLSGCPAPSSTACIVPAKWRYRRTAWSTRARE